MVASWWQKTRKVTRLGIIVFALLFLVYILSLLYSPLQSWFYTLRLEWVLYLSAIISILEPVIKFVLHFLPESSPTAPEDSSIDNLINEMDTISRSSIEAIRDNKRGYSSVWEDYSTATKTKFPNDIQSVLDDYIDSIKKIRHLAKEEREIADGFVTELPGGKIYSQRPPQVTTRVESTPADTPQPWGDSFSELLWEHKDIIFSSDSPEELRARLIQEAERKHFRNKNIFEWYEDSWLKTRPYQEWYNVLYQQKENSTLEEYVKIIEEQKENKSAAERHAEKALRLLKRRYRE